MRTTPLLAIVLIVSLAAVSLAHTASSGPEDPGAVDRWLVLEAGLDGDVRSKIVPAQPHHGGGGHDPLNAHADGWFHCSIQVAPLDDGCFSGGNHGWYAPGDSIVHRLFVPVCPGGGCFVGTLTTHISSSSSHWTFSCDIIWISVIGGILNAPGTPEVEQAYDWTCQTQGTGDPTGDTFRHHCETQAHPDNGQLAGFWDCGMRYDKW